MSEDKVKEEPEAGSDDEATEDRQEPSRSGPTFTESPDPLAGLRKSTGNVWTSMEGKTVSMRVYVGTIVGIVILMLLARCGS